MKIFEVIEAKKHPIDNLDDVDDDPEQDADFDDVPNIIQQVRKALDVDGNYPITFKDGTKTKLSMDEIASFVKKYMTAKPSEKEELQSQAIQSLNGFKQTLAKEFHRPVFPKSKGGDHMRYFSDEPPTLSPEYSKIKTSNYSDREEKTSTTRSGLKHAGWGSPSGVGGSPQMKKGGWFSTAKDVSNKGKKPVFKPAYKDLNPPDEQKFLKARMKARLKARRDKNK